MFSGKPVQPRPAGHEHGDIAACAQTAILVFCCDAKCKVGAQFHSNLGEFTVGRVLTLLGRETQAWKSLAAFDILTAIKEKRRTKIRLDILCAAKCEVGAASFRFWTIQCRKGDYASQRIDGGVEDE
ncbi:hypothetical protein K438DRAFT_1764616 [Mycena galopus ATCC 62051]|nr:hypothetical protein K438DRAFT_1764616 [Mycena galopus ATCC 62051]